MAEDTQGNRDTQERRMDGVTWSAEGPTNPAPRTIPTEKVDRMRERCGLDPDFGGVHRERGYTGARGTGRTTLMLLHALVAYEGGEGVAVIGANNELQIQSRFEELAGKARVGEHGLGRPLFIDAGLHARGRARGIPRGWRVFVDHWAAHQMVELSLGGAVVMESPS